MKHPLDAATDVIAERKRQKTIEGWTEVHDDGHDDQSLAQAAACYAMPHKHMMRRRNTHSLRGVPLETGDAFRQSVQEIPILWPDSWAPAWWKPKGRRRDLVRAGALILAEIERLD